MPPVSLKAENIGKAFEVGTIRRLWADAFLKDISFEVKPGETLGIMGESGAGKTTLVKIAAGLAKPSSGRVVFNGENIFSFSKQEWKHFRKNVQMVFQNPESSLNPAKRLRRILQEAAGLREVPKNNWEEVLQDVLETVGLSEDILDRFPFQVSGGENQRIVLARVLLLKPKIILLDEPTSALDISVRAQILHLLKQLQKENNLGYLFVSHDRDVIDFMSNRIGVLEKGQLRFLL